MLPIRPNGERPALHVMGTNATFCFEDVPQDVVRNAANTQEAAKLGSACGSLVATGLGSDAGIIDFDATMKFAQTNPTLPLGD